MRVSIETQPTLLSATWPAAQKSAVWIVTLVIAGAALLTLSAKVNIPFYPVPMTMQTFAVLVIGMAFGPSLAIGTVGFYLLLGALGLPVFSGTPERGIGWAYMVGPTGGYLLGFLVASGIVGVLAQQGWDRSFPKTLASMTLGMLVVYIFGFAWLAGLIGVEKAWTFGVQPFMVADVFKILLAALALPMAWHLIKRRPPIEG